MYLKYNRCTYGYNAQYLYNLKKSDPDIYPPKQVPKYLYRHLKLFHVSQSHFDIAKIKLGSY